jgi:hypothetical protein
MNESDEWSRENFFSMIEKAVKPQFFLLTASFLLCVDSALVLSGGAGIRDYIATNGGMSLAIGIKCTLIFICFSGAVSLAFPILEGLTK